MPTETHENEFCPESIEATDASCRNCHTPLIGHYCSSCGQPDKHLDPSVHDLVHEVTHEFLHLDGKIATTLKVLILSPGSLTSEFLEGRRARYISPVRLYLTFSLIFFLLVAWAPERSNHQEQSAVQNNARTAEDVSAHEGQANTAVKGKSSAPAVAQSSEKVVSPEDVRPEDVDAFVQKELARNGVHQTFISKVVTKFVSKASKDGEASKHVFLSNVSRVMFFIVPLFAVGLRLAYNKRKKRYPSFIYFSLHYHTFVFLALSLYLLVSFARILTVDAVAGGAVAICCIVYLFMALRRVFGGSKRKTLLRMAALAGFYFPCFSFGLAIAGVITMLMA